MSRQQQPSPRFPRAVLATGVLYSLALAALLWPALLNSQPIFFFDTYGYVHGGARAFHALFGVDSAWNNPGGDAKALQGAARLASDGFISSARSIYYGVFLFIGDALSSLWVNVAAQAILVGWTLSLVLKHLGLAERYLLPSLLILLGLLTPLSFYSSYLMPDIFTGITILAIATLLGPTANGRSRHYGSWFVLLTLSLVFHASHIAIALLMAVAGPAIAWAVAGRNAVQWRGLFVVLLAIASGFLSQLVFSRVVEATYHHPPSRPPFLMSRVISDGPGYAYLKETCPANGFTICEFLGVLPLGNDAFLWSNDPEAGVFGVTDPETRHALVKEQAEFVGAVLRHDFGGQFRASLQNFLEQMGRFNILEFAYSDGLRAKVEMDLPPEFRDSFRASRLYRGAFPLEPANAVIMATLLCAGAILSAAALRGLLGPRPGREELTLFCLIIVSGIVLNAAVTGILSTPHDRYQARVIWLIPLLALLAALEGRRRFFTHSRGDKEDDCHRKLLEDGVS